MAYLISETGTTGKINGPALFGFGALQARLP
jgi:hypothetical protein